MTGEDPRSAFEKATKTVQGAAEAVNRRLMPLLTTVVGPAACSTSWFDRRTSTVDCSCYSESCNH